MNGPRTTPLHRDAGDGRPEEDGGCVFRDVGGTLAIAPGDRAFRIVSLVSGGAAIDPHRWAGLIDLSLFKAGESYAVTSGLPELARYGHFASPDRAWERIEF